MANPLAQVFMKRLFILLLIIGVPVVVHAAPLTQAQIERVKAAKQLLDAADPRTVKEIIEELSQTRFTEGNLQILEAVAQTYRDMLLEYPQAAQGKKEWLHSIIRLNMAYFQFGGSSEQNDSGLNITIRRKLKKYLSPKLLSDPNLFYSLE